MSATETVQRSKDKENEHQFSVIGQRVPKYDALEKVNGRAQYLIDLKLSGMLHGKILRSKYAHARILNIDISKAEALDGVVAVITAKDTPKIKFGFMKDNLPLKEKTTLSHRDEIAAVAAIDEQIAGRAIELIEVEYETLPPIHGAIEAIKEGAPHLHEEARGNIAYIPF